MVLHPTEYFDLMWSALRFDVARAWRLIERDKLDVRQQPVPIAPLIEQRRSLDGDLEPEEYAADRFKTSVPLLIVRWNLLGGDRNGAFLIDGVHRLWKAQAEGLTEMPAIIFSERETLTLLMDSRLMHMGMEARRCPFCKEPVRTLKATGRTLKGEALSYQWAVDTDNLPIQECGHCGERVIVPDLDAYSQPLPKPKPYAPRRRKTAPVQQAG